MSMPRTCVRSHMTVVILCVTVLAAYAGSASGGEDTYYVSTSGSDTGDGGAGSPWRTIGHALSQVPADSGASVSVGAGLFEEAGILDIPSGVSLIGAGSDATFVEVDHYFSLTDAVANANPHVHTFPEHFVIQMNGANQTVGGFSLDGQNKTCHGGIFAPYTNNVVFEDLRIEKMRYCALWVIEAHDTTLRYSYFKDNTYGNPASSGDGGGDSGALQYHRGTNFVIHDNHIEETGNLEPDKGGYAMKGQNLTFGSDAMALEGMRVYNNELVVPQTGAWENGMAPAIAAEFLTVKLKNLEIHHNYINNHVSLPNHDNVVDWAARIHHNFFDLGRARYAYAIEIALNKIEVDHNYFYGGIYPLAKWGGDHSDHIIHHNIFHGACADQFSGRELLHYTGHITRLKFYNNTVLDDESIGSIFDLDDGSTDADVRNNLFYKINGTGDIWGYNVNGTIDHNHFTNTGARGTNASSGDPGINIATQRPLQDTYYTFDAASALVDAGVTIAPYTDGYAGAAPEIGALERGRPLEVGIVTNVPQGPLGGAPHAVPGTIQAEDFDEGGESFAYHDSDAANTGGLYRPNDGVDIEVSLDTGGGANVGWIVAGEWTEYTVDVASSGGYDILLRVASESAGGSVAVSFEGVDATGTVSLPVTGGWQTYQTVAVLDVPLMSGVQVMRVSVLEDGFNVNWIALAASSGPDEPDTPPPAFPPAAESDGSDEGSLRFSCAAGASSPTALVALLAALALARRRLR